MLRPIYNQIISFNGFEEDGDPTSWYKKPTPIPPVENERAKILWDIPIHYLHNTTQQIFWGDICI